MVQLYSLPWVFVVPWYLMYLPTGCASKMRASMVVPYPPALPVVKVLVSLTSCRLDDALGDNRMSSESDKIVAIGRIIRIV